jgi:hypothetical protein
MKYRSSTSLVSANMYPGEGVDLPASQGRHARVKIGVKEVLFVLNKPDHYRKYKSPFISMPEQFDRRRSMNEREFFVEEDVAYPLARSAEAPPPASFRTVSLIPHKRKTGRYKRMLSETLPYPIIPFPR